MTHRQRKRRFLHRFNAFPLAWVYPRHMTDMDSGGPSTTDQYRRGNRRVFRRLTARRIARDAAFQTQLSSTEAKP